MWKFQDFSVIQILREINFEAFEAHSVEKVGILLSRFLRKSWKNFRENKTNAKLAPFT